MLPPIPKASGPPPAAPPTPPAAEWTAAPSPPRGEGCPQGGVRFPSPGRLNSRSRAVIDALSPGPPPLEAAVRWGGGSYRT